MRPTVCVIVPEGVLPEWDREAWHARRARRGTDERAQRASDIGEMADQRAADESGRTGDEDHGEDYSRGGKEGS